jgi:hypothetical protein
MDISLSVIAAAALLAAVLHLVIVLFIYGIDRKHRFDSLMKCDHIHAPMLS